MSYNKNLLQSILIVNIYQFGIDVFLQARRRGLTGKGAIIHIDRGSQYASVDYRRLLYTGGFRQSMSRRGNCYDKAQAESFFSRFKAELVENGIIADGYVEYHRERASERKHHQNQCDCGKDFKTAAGKSFKQIKNKTSDD